MWRAGLLLVASYSLFRAARWVLGFVGLPTQLEVGCGLVIAGCGLVMLSLVLERHRDIAAEGRLAD